MILAEYPIYVTYVSCTGEVSGDKGWLGEELSPPPKPGSWTIFFQNGISI